MRTICSYVSSLALSMLASVVVCAASSPVGTQGSMRVIGLSNTQHFQGPSQGQYYVQAGTFRSLTGANHYRRQLVNQFHQPVQVKAQGNYHVVVIGPLHTAAEVRALSVGITKTPAPVAVKPVDVRETVVVAVASPDHFEVTGALGIANLRADNSFIGVTSDETNKLVQTNNNKWDAFAAQFGGSYVHYLRNAQRYSDQVQWFSSIEPQINLYYLGNTDIKGDVWRFNNPQFNQLTFEASIHSTRLMFDLALNVVSRKHFSLYAIAGLGNAWNDMSYQDRDNEPGDTCPNVNLNLKSNTSSNFAWEAGGGLMYRANSRVAFTLQYLYTDLGSARSSASGNFDPITVPVIVAPRFNLSAQTASIGLHVAV